MIAPSAAYPTLFSPLRLNQVSLKNRIVSTAHATAYAIGGYPKERYRRYYERKARGGVGLIITFGSCSVHPTSSVAEWSGVANWDDSIVPDLAAMADVIHQNGARCSANSPTWVAVAPRPIHRAPCWHPQLWRNRPTVSGRRRWNGTRSPRS